MSNKLKLGVLGTGNMSNAFVCALKDNVSHIGARGRTSEATAKFSNDLGILNWFDCKHWLDADVWVLGVKPNQYKSACLPLKKVFNNCSTKPAILSLMAGVSFASLEAEFPGATIVKVMANLSIATSKPMFAVSVNKNLHSVPIVNLLKTFSVVINLRENDMHLATAILGSGPAIFLSVQQQLIESGKKFGLSDDDAFALSRGALEGATALNGKGLFPKEVIDQIASQGGTTQAALKIIKNRKLLMYVDDAVGVACKRSIEMSDNDKNNSNSD